MNPTATQSPPSPTPTSAWRGLGALLVALAVVLLVVAAFLLAAAQPETPNLFDKRWEGTVQVGWNLSQAFLGQALFAACAVVSGLGLVLSRTLQARPRDPSRQALVVLGALATGGLIYCLLAIPSA